MMPVGLRANELVPQGREPQSMAFFSAPGIERLYSGETKRMPSEPRWRSSAPGLRREVGVVVLAVQRQVPDGDLGELQVVRGELDQRLGERAVDGRWPGSRRSSRSCMWA